MTTEHPELRWFLEEDLPGSRPDLALRHVRTCAHCRAEIAVRDPSRLFALLALPTVPQGILDRLSAGVETEVASNERGLGWGWATLAASVLLAGVFGAYVWTGVGSGSAVESFSPPTVLVERGEEPAFELLSSPGTAQVVDLSVGGTRFVMIFDEDLDL